MDRYLSSDREVQHAFRRLTDANNNLQVAFLVMGVALWKSARALSNLRQAVIDAERPDAIEVHAVEIDPRD